MLDSAGSAAAPNRVAAVDIGTNSVRLLVAEREGTGFSTLHRILRLVRLGEGVDDTGRLSDAAIARTVAALSEFAGIWRAAQVDAVRITATSAARDALNAAEFSAAIADVAGVTPEVLTGEEEGRLSFLGASTVMIDRSTAAVAVLDIGGGSTEMVVGTEHPTAFTSRQIGCVRLTERLLRSDPPTPAEVEATRVVIAAELDGIASDAPPTTGARLVAVAGTATTLAALDAGLDGYEQGAVHAREIAMSTIDALTTQLLNSTAAQIAALPAVQEGRADVLAAGALILQQTMRRFDFDVVTISESDSLDGVALSLLRRGGGDDVRAAAAAKELVEVVSSGGKVIEVITRAEMRRRGARHRTTYVVVVRRNGDVVVHQRSAWKDVSPSCWDIAFGGVCDVGEGWLPSATRELAEEAGITGAALVDLGQVNFDGTRVSLVGRVFVTVHDGPLALEDGEVVAVDEIPISELDTWMEDHPMIEDSPVVVPPLLAAWWAGRTWGRARGG